MKKIFFLLLFIFTLGLLVDIHKTYAKTSPSVSPTATNTASPSGSQNSDMMNKIDQQINALKDKIASRVAQLDLVEKRGFIGTVAQTSGTEMKVTDTQNNIRFIDVDELTKFSSSSAKDIGISDLKNGTLVGILGNYNKDSKRILARFITVMTLPTTVSGLVNTIDNKNFQFTITTADQTLPAGRQGSWLIDNEVVTKTSVYTAADGLKRAGFSKINTNERVHIVGFPDKTNPNMIVASRIILLPELSPNSTVTTTTTPTPTKKK